MVAGLAPPAQAVANLGFSNSATVPYQFDGVAAYQAGDPSDLVAGSVYHASPDTGDMRITNNASSTFTGTIGFNAVSPCGGDFSQAYPVTLNPSDHVSVEVNTESSNQGGFNGTTCGDTTTPQNGAQFEMKGTVSLGSNSQSVDLTIYDKDIHSGVPQINPLGVTLDNYILQGGDPYGRDTGDGYEEAQTPGVFRFPPVSNPTVIAGEIEVGGTPVAGAHVQACLTSGSDCIPAPYVTSSGGGFAIEVPAGTYSVTALATTSFGNQSSKTAGPFTVPPSVSNVVVNFLTNALPAGTTFDGYGPGQVPNVFWGSPSTLTVSGCTGGYGVLYVRSSNTVTAQPQTLVFPMTETPSGSGTYVAKVPPLAPLHGGASAEPMIACPGQTALLPDGGDPSGGTTALITGSSFTGATSVMFGSNPAPSFTVLNDKVISAVSPAGTGTVPLVVNTPSGNQTTGAFTYFGASSMSPTSGPAGGGTNVTISGQGFTNVKGVVFGVTPAASFTVVSPTEIQAVAPPGVGKLAVQVLNGFAASNPVSPDLFAYQGGPSLTYPINEGTGPDAPAIVASAITLDCPDLSDSPIPGLADMCRYARDQLTGLTGAGPIGVLSQVFITAVVVGGAALLCFFGGCEAALAVVAVAAIGVGLGFLAYNLGVRFCGTSCPAGSFFGFYIDPSGNVVDTSGNPISGATATLLSHGPNGFAAVDPTSGAIDPATNPETTGNDGAFDWEALAGTYQVQASAPNCHAPGNPSLPNVTTSAFVIPPPALGLLLALECPGSTPPVPSVTEVSANFGSSTGGNRVEIVGTGLADASAVHFGSASATGVTPISPFAVAAVVPPGTSTVDVTVTTPGGTSAISSVDHYTYVTLPTSNAAPSISYLAPGDGPVWGGTKVAIKGSNLDGVWSVSFGGVPAMQVTDVSSGEVDAVAPASLLSGPVDVTVTRSAGTSSITGFDIFRYTAGVPVTACTATEAGPAATRAVSTQQYSLAGSDGASWQEIDPGRLRLACLPTASQPLLLIANSDLWTANAGVNQDLGIFASDNGGADQLLGWKESGGFAGTFSPNAAYLQSLYTMVAGHSYVFKLKWKTNKPASAATIYAGAGTGPVYSPTSLVAESFPAAVPASLAASSQQYHLAGSDGATWQAIDVANLSTTLSPAANSTAVLGGNADLWTANAGFNQDLGIFVSDNGGADQLVAWKESGGSAGTFSPNAAFVKATYAMSAGHSYVFKLKWKTNKPAAGATIYAAAGQTGSFSPTSLFAETLPAGANPYGAVSTSQYSLANSNGSSWQLIDSALNVTVSPTSSGNSILGGNADLWTANPGFNQDLGIFVSDNGGADQLVAWKESGGFAGTFSPNAAFVEALYPLSAGHTYIFKLKWKTNKAASGATIYAAAGGPAPFSPTRLTVELTG